MLNTNIFTQYKGLSRSVWVIFIARIVTNMGAFIWPMLTLILSRKLGYSAFTIAVISIGVMVLFIPAQIIGGKLADRFSKKKIIITFDLISVVMFISCGFLEPGTPMLVLFVIAGLFATLEGPAFDALITESTKPNERDKVFSLTYLGHNIGYIFGATVGGLLFENFLNLAFIFDGLTTLTSTVLIVIFVQVINVDELEEEEKNDYEDSEEDHISAWEIIFNRKSILVVLILILGTSFIYSQWSFILPLYITSIMAEEGAKFFGIISGFNGLVVVLFTPMLTKMLEKRFELSKSIIGMALYAVSFLMLIGARAPWIFFVMIFVFTIGEIMNSLSIPPFISRRIPASHRGRVNSFIGICYMVGSMVGQFVTGYIVDYTSYEAAFILVAVLSGIISFGFIVNLRIDKHRFPKLYDRFTLESVEESI